MSDTVSRFRFEWCEDYPLLESILKRPRLYRIMAEDTAPPAEQLRIDPTAINGVFLLATLDDDPVAFWLFEFRGHGIVEIHTCIHDAHWGPTAKEVARDMLAWVWANTTWTKIMTHVPKTNRLAFAFARAAGMVECGMKGQSFLKGGVMHDQYILSLDRPEVDLRR